MFGSFEGSPSVSFIFCLIKVFPYMEPQPDFMALKWHNRLFLAWLLVSADQLAEEERVIPNFKYKQECGQTRSAEGSSFGLHVEAAKKAWSICVCFHPPTLLLSRVSVQSPGRDKGGDVEMNGNAASVAETHTHTQSLFVMSLVEKLLPAALIWSWLYRGDPADCLFFISDFCGFCTKFKPKVNLNLRIYSQRHRCAVDSSWCDFGSNFPPSGIH